MANVNHKLLMLSVSTAAAFTFYNLAPNHIAAEEVEEELADVISEDIKKEEKDEDVNLNEELEARKDDEADDSDDEGAVVEEETNNSPDDAVVEVELQAEEENEVVEAEKETVSAFSTSAFTVTEEEPQTLTIGTKGEAVLKLQNELRQLGFFVNKEINGVFDSVTLGEIKSFQQYYSLKVTGEADETTLNKINSILNSPFKNGERHDETILLKENLSLIGFHVSSNPTTLYGTSTEIKVRDFQKYYGLRISGIADDVTLEKIENILNSPFRNGKRHEETIRLKEKLSFLGFHVSNNPTTLYGTSTETKVREFQLAYGLVENGIADEITLAKIEALSNVPMQNGMYRQDVIDLKKNLSIIGFHVSNNPTNYYGSSTEKKVKEFQKYFKLKVTGIADEATLAKIDSILNSPFQVGVRHNETINLKENLADIGFHISNTPTTLYGSTTAAKVSEFQNYYGLVVNGIADEVTLQKINDILSSPFRVGNRYDGTIQLKTELSQLGFHISDNPTTLYGSETEATVREFQLYYGLVVNGIADEVTFAKIEQIKSSPFQNGYHHNNTIKLKEDLSRLGFHISNNPTTLYGNSTESTVRDFQSYYGLRVNGIADEVTFAKIAEILSSPFQNGRRHSGTKKLKEDLAKLGYFISNNPTNLYGSSTETVVRQFQRNNGLRVNGIADEVTLALIEELSKNNSKETITYTQYNLTLKEAIERQSLLNPPPQTDKYRNVPAYLHSSVVKIVEGITTGNVNLRYEPTTNSDRLRLAYTNTTLNITGEVQGQSISGNTLWYRINYDGTTVYASAVYVRPTKVATTVTSNVREATNTSSHVFARVSSNSHYTINRVITDGSSVSGSRVWYDIALGTWRNAKVSDFESYIDPNQNDIYQHLVLDSYAGATAAQLNTVLKGKGVLDGMGAAFVEASRTHSVNEIYLISHAILETGHGTSKLATGIEVGKNSRGDLVLVTSSNRSSLTNIKTTYNMFGIGAADVDPYGLGAKYAYNAGWFTPEAAIIGGAQFIYSGYMSRGQNTLYKMRWNFAYPTSTGFLPQYATDMGWAVKQVSNIKNLYQLIENAPKKFDIVQYK